MIRVFLDSSVLFTAVNSPTGGSAKLFVLKKLKLVASKIVLAEVERNVRQKLQSYHLERFFRLVQKMEIKDQLPDKHLIAGAKKVIVVKDAVILAEAKQSGVEYLVTLDRKHFFTEEVEKFLKPKKAMTPKMLISALT